MLASRGGFVTAEHGGYNGSIGDGTRCPPHRPQLPRNVVKLPQFTIRDLFWLALVVGLALGWWLDSRWGLTRKDNYLLRSEVEFLRRETDALFEDLKRESPNVP